MLCRFTPLSRCPRNRFTAPPPLSECQSATDLQITNGGAARQDRLFARSLARSLVDSISDPSSRVKWVEVEESEAGRMRNRKGPVAAASVRSLARSFFLSLLLRPISITVAKRCVHETTLIPTTVLPTFSKTTRKGGNGRPRGLTLRGRMRDPIPNAPYIETRVSVREREGKGERAGSHAATQSAVAAATASSAFYCALTSCALRLLRHSAAATTKNS